MAITLTPTLTAQRWGNEHNQVFDYFAHPTRDTGGNPLIIFRHAGGAKSDNYQSVWTLDREPARFFEYINSTSRGTHFDVISISTAQRSFDASYASGRKTFILGQVAEFQKAIVAIKQLGKLGFGSSNTYKIDPSRIILFGNSHGANLASLSQLMPPFMDSSSRALPIAGVGDNTQAWSQRVIASGNTSNVAGVIYLMGQVDVRYDSVQGQDSIAYSDLDGWFGTSTSSATQFNALPAMLRNTVSTLWYLETGRTQFYCPHYIMYQSAGTTTKPYANVHASYQGTLFANAAALAGLSYSLDIYTLSDWTFTNSPKSAALYAWCVQTLGKYLSPVPVTTPGVAGPSTVLTV